MSRKKIESKPYGSAITEISITENDYWFLLKNGKNPQPFKKIKDLTGLLSKEVSSVSGYKPGGKTFEEQVWHLIEFCNQGTKN